MVNFLLNTCYPLLVLRKKKKIPIWEKIISGNEKWIYYQNPKQGKLHLVQRQSSKSQPKLNNYIGNLYGLKILWGEKEILIC